MSAPLEQRIERRQRPRHIPGNDLEDQHGQNGQRPYLESQDENADPAPPNNSASDSSDSSRATAWRQALIKMVKTGSGRAWQEAAKTFKGARHPSTQGEQARLMRSDVSASNASHLSSAPAREATHGGAMYKVIVSFCLSDGFFVLVSVCLMDFSY